jgi:putative flippase GtrA
MRNAASEPVRLQLVGQLSRFSVVGALNTGIDLLVLNILTLLSGVTDGAGYAVQKALSFCVAALFSYAMNKRWTFGDTSTGGQRRKLAQFFAISGLGALINVVVATVVVTYLRDLVDPGPGGLLTDQLWVNLGALCGSGAGFLWNFAGYKLVVFRS